MSIYSICLGDIVENNTFTSLFCFKQLEFIRGLAILFKEYEGGIALKKMTNGV